MDELLDAMTGGALWGIGFGLALSLVQTAGTGVRPVAKRLVKGVVEVGDRVATAAQEVRESIEDLAHEVEVERSRTS